MLNLNTVNLPVNRLGGGEEVTGFNGSLALTNTFFTPLVHIMGVSLL